MVVGIRFSARWRMVAATTAAALILAACSSSAASPGPTSIPTTAAGATATLSVAGATAVTGGGGGGGGGTLTVKCPTAAVVGAALGRSEAKPLSMSNTIGGQAMTVCTYAIKGSTSGEVSTVSFTTFPSAAIAAIGKAQWAAKGTAVSGLGDAAYSVPANNTLGVFVGTVFLTLTSPGASPAQLEALATKILAG